MTSLVPFKELSGIEYRNYESFVDAINKNGFVYKRYYTKYTNLTEEQINNIIDVITITNNFVLDKENKEYIELVETTNGKDRLFIWNNKTVEFTSEEYIGLASEDNIFHPY